MQFHAQLCAGCHALRAFAGRPAALLTNWDQALLVLVLGGSSTAGGRWPELRRCTALPFRTVSVQPLSPPLQAFVAAGALVLADRKLQDDVDDGGGVLPKAARRLLRGRVTKGEQQLRELGFPVALTSQLAARQRRIERSAQPGLGELAAPTAELMAEVFGHGARLAGRPAHAEALARFGRAIGCAVYGLDALVDQAKDAQRGRFNAVAALRRVHGDGAVSLAQAFVAEAVAAARQAVAGVLDPARLVIVHAILDRVVQRAGAATPVARAFRSEAGACDLACDAMACDACACESLSCGGGEATACGAADAGLVELACCLCPPWGERRRKRAAKASADSALLFGRTGMSVGALRPRGLVDVDGVRHTAEAVGEWIPAANPVRVVGERDGRLLVVADKEPDSS